MEAEIQLREVTVREAVFLLAKHGWVRRKTKTGVIYQDPKSSKVIAVQEGNTFRFNAEYL